MKKVRKSGWSNPATSVLMKKNWKNSAFLAAWKVGCNTPEARAKRSAHISRTNRVHWRDPEYRKRMLPICSKAGKKAMEINWQNPEFVHAHAAGKAKSPSRASLSLLETLKSKGLRGFQAEVPCGVYSIDVAHLTQKLAIEVDGRYWHSLPGRAANDRRKDRFLESRGWRVLRIPAERLKYIRYWLQEIRRLLCASGS